MEITVERQRDRDAIAEEAVGQRHVSGLPDAVKETAETSTDETVRRLAKSSGSEASTPEKTAEAVGERVVDAYSDPEPLPRETRPRKLLDELKGTGISGERRGQPIPRCRPRSIAPRPSVT